MVKEIPLQNGMVALVDDEDYEKVSHYNWYYNSTSLSVKYKELNLQRLIMGLEKNDKKFVIFSDRNSLNCQKDNLIIGTALDRSIRKKGDKNSSSKYKGVTWDKKRFKWKAQIGICGKLKYLGCFINEDDAARAYNKAALEFLGENAYQNIIGGNNNAIEKIASSEKNRRIITKLGSGTSKFRGVSLCKITSKWRVHIGFEGKVECLGYFIDEAEAARSYDKKSYELRGKNAYLNFPDEYKKS